MPSSPFSRAASLAILALATFLTLYPVAWMISASFKAGREVFTHPVLSLGSSGVANYLDAFAERPFFLYLLNRSPPRAHRSSSPCCSARSPATASPSSATA